jgi:RHS repeat-associated protein
MDAVLDDTGQIVTSASFDSWGERRSTVDWRQIGVAALGPNPISLLRAITARGFTGHEMIDALGIVHMNGRIYDAHLGRFLQADPIVQNGADLQSFNRYSYVRNNPVNLVDPSGYSWLSKKWKKLWKNKIFRVVVAAVVTYVTAGWAAGWAGGLVATAGISGTAATIATGAIVGAVAGFAGGAVMTGTLKGALTGAVSGALFGGIGGYFDKMANLQGGVLNGGQFTGKVLSHATAGGVMNDLQGGKFGHGFISAGMTAAFGGSIDNIDKGQSRSLLRVMAASTVGGTTSKLTGGKFANGAMTGAFSRALNDEMKGFHAQKDEPLLLDGDQSKNVFKIHRYDTDGVVIDEQAQSLATDMYFKALKADEGMIWVERVFKAFAGGFKPKPGGILSMGTSTMTSEAKEYFRVGEYKSIEARLSATGAGIIHTNAANADNRIRYSELNRE